MRSRDPVQLLVALHVDRGGENIHGVWIARKLVSSLHLTGKTTKGTDRNGQMVNLPMANITIPEWLAIKSGLI